ncbi:magnesium chelatase domain-containing protein [Streptomyces sp. NPDC127037]|uniref:magnesium chelatase domain-containing protein n=1 Tax=Streptomyces sp. NPDC127037 TaxID=3347113 RepID=UPI003656162C
MSNTIPPREFVIVGKDTGTGFILWDVAPTPTDPTKRAIALEEIGVDIADALGDAALVTATSARAAVDQHLRTLADSYGRSTYDLHPDSQLDSYEADAPTQPAHEDSSEPFGRAHVLSATRDAGYRIEASSVSGTAVFKLDGLPLRYPRETRDRVRAGVLNSGLDWPMANVLVKIAPIGSTDDATCVGTSGLDLAIACSVLAAAGQLPADCLTGASLVGELGLDGGVRIPYGLPSTVSRLGHGGQAVIVPAAAVQDLRHTGARLIGVSCLNEALAVLAGHWHHATDCTHCTSTRPHQPCTKTEPCSPCREKATAAGR